MDAKQELLEGLKLGRKTELEGKDFIKRLQKKLQTRWQRVFSLPCQKRKMIISYL